MTKNPLRRVSASIQRALLEATPEGRRLVERYEAGDGSMHFYINLKSGRIAVTIDNDDGEFTVWSEPIE